jgi:hypothetical protein
MCRWFHGALQHQLEATDLRLLGSQVAAQSDEVRALLIKVCSSCSMPGRDRQ